MGLFKKKEGETKFKLGTMGQYPHIIVNQIDKTVSFKEGMNKHYDFSIDDIQYWTYEAPGISEGASIHIFAGGTEAHTITGSSIDKNKLDECQNLIKSIQKKPQGV